ncbi:vesicle associated membrane protein 1a [Clarias gariepinus]|uniref:vesicle associated membrane protein 1a n=1 Tax=Clarias gariepinus TaxID=13013 RepID=UPI00234D61C4|nr:vesicle associated membrane protein 1a [Clarias gariepinus]
MSAPDQDVTADPGAPDREGGPAAPAAQPPNTSSNLRLQHTQAQVDEVVDIIRVNLDTIMDRDKNLSNLDDRADALHSGAKMFESSAAKLKNKYWWKNCKMMIIMGVIVVLLICVAIVYFYH